jgi:transcription elongation factor Elf1
MPYLQKFYFFRCYHCGAWHYSNKKIKTKKCLKCNRSFQFKNSAKFSKNCLYSTAIKIIKELKAQKQKENIVHFLKYKN